MSNDRAADTAADMESNTENALQDAIKGQLGDLPVHIHIHSIRKRPTDADNVSAKAAIDGIVKAGVLDDDNHKIVKSVTHSQEKGDDEKTVISIILAKC